PRTRHTMATVRRGHLPFRGYFGIVRRFFGWLIIFRAQQFLACPAPIRVGKLIWVAFVDHRNLAGAPFDVLRARNSHSVAMERNFSPTRFVFLHTLELRNPNQFYVQKVTTAKCSGKEDFPRCWIRKILVPE